MKFYCDRMNVSRYDISKAIQTQTDLKCLLRVNLDASLGNPFYQKTQRKQEFRSLMLVCHPCILVNDFSCSTIPPPPNTSTPTPTPPTSHPPIQPHCKYNAFEHVVSRISAILPRLLRVNYWFSNRRHCLPRPVEFTLEISGSPFEPSWHICILKTYWRLVLKTGLQDVYKDFRTLTGPSS